MLVHHRSKINFILVGLATLVGAVVRWALIAKSSIWHDEGFSIMLSLRTPIEIWAGSARDVHPPMYYELLHYWMQLFGSSVSAIRSLSVVAGVLIIPLSFLIVKKMFGARAGVLTAFFVALSPFLIRYSIEARMYGVLGVFTLLALYAVVILVHHPKNNWAYLLYALAVAAGLYTHYFMALAVVSFWVYLMIIQKPHNWRFNKTIFLSMRWWLANVFALLLFLPWIPSMIAQFRRAQGLSWLTKTNIWTFHDTIWQFFAFDSGRSLYSFIYILFPLAIIAAVIVVIYNDKTKVHYSRLLVVYSFLPLAIAILVSGFKPIFHERYFAFVVAGMCMLIAVAIVNISRNKKVILSILALGILSIQILGIRNVYSQSSHKMQVVMDQLNRGYQASDMVLAAELYVYFDGSYYNKSDQKMYLYTGINKPNGYGESGLLYDKSVYLESYDDIENGRVWLIGKTGEQDYYRSVPDNWKLLEQYSAGYSEVRLYQVQ
ncbi:MAG: Membrane protein [Patescibacteria group bacterium]|jgi:4-amino-4-deoxy-L-arabinose transferase-like glycosyltransferase|nr:Membrane protein [Patescibacteria group bacterium]